MRTKKVPGEASVPASKRGATNETANATPATTRKPRGPMPQWHRDKLRQAQLNKRTGIKGKVKTAGGGPAQEKFSIDAEVNGVLQRFQNRAAVLQKQIVDNEAIALELRTIQHWIDVIEAERKPKIMHAGGTTGV